METKTVAQPFSHSVPHRNDTFSNTDFREEANYGTAFITSEQITDGNTDPLIKR